MRKFKACAVREENATGIGLVECVNDGDTVAIHSIFYDTRLSNRDTYVNALEHLLAQLDDEEPVILRTALMTDKHVWRAPYQPQVKSRGERYRYEPFNEPLQLAKDGIKRKNSICEELGVTENAEANE